MTSFANDIRPLFRDSDISAMDWMMDLGDYEEVRSHAHVIHGALAARRMPCDGPWPQEQVDLFKRWIDEGMEP